MGKDKAPPPIVKRTAKGLFAIDAQDAQDIAADPLGTEYDLVKRSTRRWRHLRTYWKALALVVHNDDRWPSPEHLHHNLKLACGYKWQAINMETGEFADVVDSIAFDKMTQPQFKKYMDIAMEKLASVIGYDPLAFLEDAA